MRTKYTMIALIKDTAVIGAIFATGVVIDEKAMIPIGTLLAVCGFVWWMGRKLQRIDDQLETINDKLKTLPCEKWSECPPKKEKTETLKML